MIKKKPHMNAQVAGSSEVPPPLSGLLVARGLREVTEGMGQESTCAPEPQSRPSVKQTGDSKLLGLIIIFSGLGRNTNYSLRYQNIEICFILKTELGIHRLIR